MVDLFLNNFSLYFVMLDPIGMIPIFIATTVSFDDHHRLVIIRATALYSFALLVFFIVAGSWLFDTLEISSSAIGIGGGTILYVIALEMLFERRQRRREKESASRAEALQIAVFPLAMPLIVGPGIIIAVVLKRDEMPGLFSIASLTDLAAILAVLAIMTVAMIFAGKLQKLLGDRLLGLLSRLMGLILAILATQITLNAVTDLIRSI